MLSLLLAFTVSVNMVPVPVETIDTPAGVALELQPIIRELRASFAQFELTDGWQVEIEDHSIVFGTDSSYVVIDGELKSIPANPVIRDGKCYMPLAFYTDILCPLIGARCTGGSEELSIHRSRAGDTTLTGIQLHYLTGFTKVVLTFDGPVSYDLRHSPGHARISFDRVLTVAGDLAEVHDPLVSAILPERSAVDIILKSENLLISDYTLGNPFRVVLDISRTTPTDHKPDRPVASLPSYGRRGVFTVALDPGHGGKDSGAVTSDGLVEKNLTLDVALRVAKILRGEYGYGVEFTRTDDTDAALEERTARANEVRADAFVSIHANSARVPTAHGAEVYYLTLDTIDTQAGRIAADENLGGGPSDDLSMILWDLAQNASLTGSARLAEAIAREMAETIGLPERGVKQAPFRVLMGATMPATLIELGFLTSAEDAKLLRDPAYLAQQARAIARAIHQFQIETGDRWSDR